MTIKIKILSVASIIDKITFDLKRENVIAVITVGANIFIVYDTIGGDPFP